MGRRTDAKVASEEIIRTEQTKQALELRRAGKSYRAIGELLGVSQTTAANWVSAALAAIPKESADALRTLELERLDKLYEGLTAASSVDDNGRITSGGAHEGHPQAVLAVVKVLERRARMLGLDAPTKVDARFEHKPLKDMSDEELLELRASLEKRQGLGQ